MGENGYLYFYINNLTDNFSSYLCVLLVPSTFKQFFWGFVNYAGVDSETDTDEVAPGTENLVAPGAESSVASQVTGVMFMTMLFSL